MEKYYLTNLNDLLLCMKKAINFINPEIEYHHQQVAYLSYKIGIQMGMLEEELKDLLIAAMLHDVGSIAFGEELEILNEGDRANAHAYAAYKLLEKFNQFAYVANIIKYHHLPWNHGSGRSFDNERVMDQSHIINLADKVVVRLNRNKPIINQVNRIKHYVSNNKGSLFADRVVDAFMEISEKESLWLYLAYYPESINDIMEYILRDNRLTMDDVVSLTDIFARIIDFRSPFTAMHSAGVAAAAVEIARHAGFSSNECKMMKIAGNLHDLGKLKTPKEILEKNSSLNEEEYNIMKEHSFYTYMALKDVSGFEEITKWAAFHHEKMNGNGYPFHLKAEMLPIGARVMAVADIFTAITEDRPYRKGMAKNDALKVIIDKTNDGDISKYISTILIKYFDEVVSMREKAADKAIKTYKSFTEQMKISQEDVFAMVAEKSES